MPVPRRQVIPGQRSEGAATPAAPTVEVGEETAGAAATEAVKLRREVKLAINPLDLLGLNPGIVPQVLKGRIDLDPKKTVVVDTRGVEERCSVFTCDTFGAALAIDLLRNEARHEKRELRAYINRGSTWFRLPLHIVLTKPDGAGYTLDPKWFPVVEETGILVAPPVTPVLTRKRK